MNEDIYTTANSRDVHTISNSNFNNGLFRQITYPKMTSSDIDQYVYPNKSNWNYNTLQYLPSLWRFYVNSRGTVVVIRCSIVSWNTNSNAERANQRRRKWKVDVRPSQRVSFDRFHRFDHFDSQSLRRPFIDDTYQFHVKNWQSFTIVSAVESTHQSRDGTFRWEYRPSHRRGRCQ